MKGINTAGQARPRLSLRLSMKKSFPLARVRLILFLFVAALHVVLILLVAFNIDTVVNAPMPVAALMRLVDIQENYDLLPPPASSPEITPGPPQTNTQEAIAEYMVETDVEPPPAVIGAWTGPPGLAASGEEINYLSQSRITSVPVFPEDQIRRAIIYPPIAQRSNIEGSVRLELFIDRTGVIRDVRIRLENPSGRGFGEAAVNAFKGIRAKPAEADGVPVAVRYMYNLTFKLN